MKQLAQYISVIMLITSSLMAQEKYAVLITGDYAGKGIPLNEQWNQGIGKNPYFEEFWYDTYLMWELLLSKGYSDENIIVLFADGIDYQPDWIADRYNPHLNFPDIVPEFGNITDYSATIGNVSSVFTGLANGINGLPQVTQDDFLFVWTFNNNSNDAVVRLINNEKILKNEFIALTDQINCNKEFANSENLLNKPNTK